MEELKRETEKLSTLKAILGIFLSIAILVVAQILTFSISEILLNFGLPSTICNIIAAILYVVFTFVGTTLLCNRFLKVPIAKMRIPHIQLKAIWLVSAILMPILVLFIYMLIGGHWETNTFDTKTTLVIITSGVAFYGLATGIVEEIIFLGLIMGCLEKRFNIKIDIIIPSVLFGLLHNYWEPFELY